MNFLQRLFWTPLLLLVFSPSSAQNWHPFPSGRIPIFKFVPAGDSVERFLASRIDSVRQEGGAEAHYFYRIDRPFLPGESVVGCSGGTYSNRTAYALNQDHYFGQKALLAPGGRCTFVSSAGDSFVVETRLPTGQSWTFHGNLTATVQQVFLDSVLGAPDSVRVITISDGREIRLSKGLGIVRMPNLLPFCLWADSLRMCDFWLEGEQTTGLGTTLPGWREIFEFAPGDRVAVRDWGGYGLGLGWSQLTLNTYLGRNLSYPLGYSVEYDLDRLDHQASGPAIHTQDFDVPTTYVYDSIAYMHLNRLPYEHLPHIAYMEYPAFLQSGAYRSTFHDRIGLSFTELSNWQCGVYDSCSNTVPGSSPPELEFVAGLGRIHRLVPTNTYPTIWTMACYTKGAELYANCNTVIVGDPGSIDFGSERLLVYPSLAMSGLNIDWPTALWRKPVVVAIFSTDGRRVFSLSPDQSTGHFELDLSNWLPGVYTVSISEEGGPREAKRFVKLR